jgi:hypothetical protein
MGDWSREKNLTNCQRRAWNLRRIAPNCAEQKRQLTHKIKRDMLKKAGKAFFYKLPAREQTK